MSGPYTQSSFDSTQGTNVGSYNTQDEFVGYGTAFNNPNRFVLQLDKRVHMIAPNASPFLSWATMVNKKPVSGFEYLWTEDELFTHRDVKAKIHYDATTGVVALKMANAGDWQAFETAADGDSWDDDKPLIHMVVTLVSNNSKQFAAILKTPSTVYGPTARTYTNDALDTVALSNEIVIYDPDNDTPSSGKATVLGGDNNEVEVVPLASTYGAAHPFIIADWATDDVDVYVKVITPNEYLKGFAQGSGLANENRKRSRTFRNYTQIFKDSWTLSDTMLKAAMYGPSELARLRLRKVIQHKVDIERALLFQGGGVEHTDYGIMPESGATNPKTRFKGLGVGATTKATAGFISTKNGEWEPDFQFNTSSMDIPAINALCAAVFDDTVDAPSSTKIAFASQKWMLALSNAAAGRGTGGGAIFGDFMQEKNSLGLTVTTLRSPAGNLRFVPMPLFRGMYEDYAMVVDMANIVVRPFSGRNTTLHADAGDKTLDGRLDWLVTELGFEAHHEATHALLKLVTS